jgi:hypothetical protein
MRAAWAAVYRVSLMMMVPPGTAPDYHLCAAVAELVNTFKQMAE